MRAAALVVFAALLACGPKEAPGAVTLQTTTVDDAGAPLRAEFSFLAKGKRQVDIIIKLVNSGIEESEKLVADVQIQGFDIVTGSTHWDGFVPPRQPQSHTVHLVVAEGFDQATAEITLRRSADSKMLMSEVLELTVGEDGRVHAAN
jgi:hypothetical protein